MTTKYYADVMQTADEVEGKLDLESTNFIIKANDN